MYSRNLKRPVVTAAIIAGLLAIAAAPFSPGSRTIEMGGGESLMADKNGSR